MITASLCASIRLFKYNTKSRHTQQDGACGFRFCLPQTSKRCFFTLCNYSYLPVFQFDFLHIALVTTSLKFEKIIEEH